MCCPSPRLAALPAQPGQAAPHGKRVTPWEAHHLQGLGSARRKFWDTSTPPTPWVLPGSRRLGRACTPCGVMPHPDAPRASCEGRGFPRAGRHIHLSRHTRHCYGEDVAMPPPTPTSASAASLCPLPPLMRGTPGPNPPQAIFLRDVRWEMKFGVTGGEQRGTGLCAREGERLTGSAPPELKHFSV